MVEADATKLIIAIYEAGLSTILVVWDSLISFRK